MRAKIHDFSHWTEPVNFDILATKTDGVIMKASQGNYLPDHSFPGYWANAAKHNMIGGHYHYYDPGINPHSQALYYYEVTRAVGASKSDFPPILDVEMPPFVSAHIHETLEEISSLFNRKPMVYTSPSVWGSMGILSWSKDYPLWVAQYPFKEKLLQYIPLYDAMNPWLPIGFNTWKIWQCAGDLPGSTWGATGSMDYNLFNGTLDELKAWVGKPVLLPLPKIELPLAVVLEGGLRVRSRPSTLGIVLGSLNKGAVVQYAATTQKGSNIWLAIMQNELIGWSAMTYNGVPLLRTL